MVRKSRIRTTVQNSDMEKVSFHFDKSEGTARVRYRLRDGRKVQICHTSDIVCDLKDLAKLNPDGTTKDRVQIYDTTLSRRLKEEYATMLKAYAIMCDEGMDITTAIFEREIAKIKSPIQVVRSENPPLIKRFRQYADRSLRDGIIGADRHKHIIVVSDKLERFLVIQGLSGITAEEFSIDNLLDFRDFLFNEYIYVEKYPKLYEGVKPQNTPRAPLSMNTVTSQLKMFQTFFTELEDTDEIHKSPFRKLGKEKKKAVMRTKYDDPIYLKREELLSLLKMQVAPSLQDTKDAFLLQCALGCRISDYATLNMSSIAVSDEGIPYIHYLPHKTAAVQAGNVEVQTPLVRYAFDIIKRTHFDFPILNNISGEYGYNPRIKAILQQAKIDRPVAQYNEETKRNDYVPLYKVASSKLARKTHVDLMHKVQIDPYASGLHKHGSSAVSRYTILELKDRFHLMNAAFDQKPYRVNRDLNVLQ